MLNFHVDNSEHNAHSLLPLTCCFVYMNLVGEFPKCVAGRGYPGHTAAVSELDPTRLCV